MKTVLSKQSYNRGFARKMYDYFLGYGENTGAPSFEKFARRVGCTAEDIERFRENATFERVYKECLEIRRDYLIDNALTKRFDPSFVKFLLAETETTQATKEDALRVTLQVLGESDAQEG